MCVRTKLGDAPTIACPSMCAAGAGKISAGVYEQKTSGAARTVVCDPSDDPIAVRLRGLNTVVSSEGVPRHCAIAPFIDYRPGLGFSMRRATTTHSFEFRAWCELAPCFQYLLI
jgi:hypothetical protein